MRRMRTGALVVATLLSGLTAGCGATGFKVPTVPSTDFSPPKGDAATFVVDGTTISVIQNGAISSRYSDVPALTYSGPLGCRGRFFTADYSEHIRILFHYSAHNAYLLVGQDLYRFGGAPTRQNGRLAWAHRFGGHVMAVTVACPPPPRRSKL